MIPSHRADPDRKKLGISDSIPRFTFIHPFLLIGWIKIPDSARIDFDPLPHLFLLAGRFDP